MHPRVARDPKQDGRFGVCRRLQIRRNAVRRSGAESEAVRVGSDAGDQSRRARALANRRGWIVEILRVTRSILNRREQMLASVLSFSESPGLFGGAADAPARHDNLRIVSLFEEHRTWQ